MKLWSELKRRHVLRMTALYLVTAWLILQVTEVLSGLIEARSDLHLWSETYERELTAANVFEIQTQIANSIANALNAVLTTKSEPERRRAPTRNLPALEAYLLGKQHLVQRSK